MFDFALPSTSHRRQHLNFDFLSHPTNHINAISCHSTLSKSYPKIHNAFLLLSSSQTPANKQKSPNHLSSKQTAKFFSLKNQPINQVVSLPLQLQESLQSSDHLQTPILGAFPANAGVQYVGYPLLEMKKKMMSPLFSLPPLLVFWPRQVSLLVSELQKAW